MAFSELEKVFLSRCEEYAKSINAINTKITSDKKTAFFSISLPVIKLQFIYSKKRGVLDLPSTIFVRVYLSKNTNLFFHIPELLAFLKIDDFRACYFPYIESEERMNCCFDALTDILNTHLADFEKIATNFRSEEMHRYQFESIRKMYGLKDEDYDNLEQYIMMIEMGETMTFLQRQTTFDAYYNLCCGEREKAIRKYEKFVSKNKVFDYEKRLFEFISKPENADFRPISDECFAYKDAKPYLMNSNVFSWKSLLISAGITTVIFFLVWFLIESLMSVGAIASYGTPWWVVLLFALLASFMNTIGFSDKLNKLAGDKKFQQRVAFNKILESKVSKDIGEILFRSLSVILFMIIAWISIYTTAVYDTYLVTPADEGMFDRVKIEYKDIDEIYYMNARYNVYGDRIERPSYVLIFKDGTMFDFDMINTAEETEKDVLPLLEKDDEIIRVDNHKEIPGYDEFFAELFEQ